MSKRVLGVSSGRKGDKETWWWNEDVPEYEERKRLLKKKWDIERTEDGRQEYREMQCKEKVQVEKTKQRTYDDWTAGWTVRGERLTYTGWRGREIEMEGCTTG